MKLATGAGAAKYGWRRRPVWANGVGATRVASPLLLITRMIELIGIGIANLFGRTVANALMDGVAAIAAIRWASLSLFVDLGVDERGRGE